MALLFIKLTTLEDKDIWLNVKFISSLFQDRDRTIVGMNTYPVEVKEPASEIIELLVEGTSK